MEHETLAAARTLDQQDVLAGFRARFVVSDPNLIYLDGNSLGRLPKATVQRVRQLVEEEWGDRLIRGWNEGWIDAPARIGDKIARLIGAQAGEVTLADSTSVNLYKLALSAVQAQPNRHTLITDDLNFPSDLYILQGICAALGPAYRLVVVPSPDGVHGPLDGLAAALDDDTALVCLSHTVFKSAYTYDMAAVTGMAHAAGAFILWDLSHAAGSVLVDLNGSEADLAVGCTYKHLNGGPGAPAFLYVRRGLQERLHNPLQGWMGQAHLFDFGLAYDAAPGLQRFLTGTPPILSASAVEPGIDLLLEAGMAQVRQKSVRQTEYLIELWQRELAPLGFTLNSPRSAEHRGSHVSLGHPEGWRIDQALIHELHVLPDFRKPDNIRFGIAPLYNSFEEIHEAIMRTRRVVVDGLYARYSAGDTVVT